MPNSTKTPPLPGTELCLATVKSGLPSPLKSPTATKAGLAPAPNVRAAAKLGAEHPSAKASSLRNKVLSRVEDATNARSDVEGLIYRGAFWEVASDPHRSQSYFFIP